MLESDLKLGDILLLKDTPDNTTVKHLGIKLGQKLTGVNRGRHNVGEANMVHALISTRYGAVAEASGAAGAVRATELKYGTYEVYSCKNRQLAKRAADAALKWSLMGGIGYAKRKAIASIFHSDDLGKHGESRAHAYATQIDSEDGGFGRGRAFCSEFVIACYQAAAIDLNIPLQGYVLESDAKHCSVRALHDRLIRDMSLFSFEGDLRKTDVLGLSVPETIA